MSKDWRDDLQSGLANLVDQAIVSGARQADVFEASIEEIELLRIANERPILQTMCWKTLSKSRQMTGQPLTE